MIDRPENSGDDIAVPAGSIRAQDGDRHDPNTRIADACNPFGIIGPGRNDARKPGAMAVGVCPAV